MIRLSIFNFILIDNHNFELKDGLTSVTGETGAGKSIVFEAIRFLSGYRSKSSIIKKGKEFAEITATLSLRDFPQLNEFVDKFDLNVEDHEIFIRRKMTATGKSSAFINNTKITITQLAEIGEVLFVIVGQHDAHLLSKPDYQLSLIDTFGEHHKQKESVYVAYRHVKDVEKELKEAIRQKDEMHSQKQLLEYQLAELEKLSPGEGEYEQLDKEHKTLSNATELSNAFLSVSEALSGNKGAIQKIREALVSLVKFDEIDSVPNITKVLENAKIELEEAGNETEALANSISFDEERYRYVEDRVNSYYVLSKRLGCHIDKLHIKYDEMAKEYQRLNTIDVAAIEKKLEQAKKSYFEISKVLSKARSASSKKFADKIDAILGNLKMRKNAFGVQIQQKEIITPKGIDEVTFMIQSNAESEVSPVVEAASGGELSRITLAINTTISASYNMRRFHLFDEIDTGVSGDTATYIGNLLTQMSESYPVVCITHIPHVAGMAKQQLHVEKHDTEKRTITDIKELTENSRKNVIATLLFGDGYSPEQLAQASKLLAA